MSSKLERLFSYDLKIFLVPIILVILSMAASASDDYDYYFIIENGKKILEDGFPYYDWMSMHEGLHIVVQQWIPSVLHYLTYEAFGLAGACVLSVACWSVLGLVLFFCSFKISKGNWALSLVTTMFYFGVASPIFASPRPQVFSALFVVLTIFVCWQYFKTKNKKLLVALPVIALAQANFHSTFYLAIIGVICSFLMFDLIFNKKEFDKAFLLVTIITIPIGLINPYGCEGILQPFYTTGYLIYDMIAELEPAGVAMLIGVLFPSFAAVLYCVFSKRITKENVPLLFIFAVTFFGAIATVRIILFTCVVAPLLFASCFPVREHKELPLGDMKGLTVKATTTICAVLLVGSIFAGWSAYGVDKGEDGVLLSSLYEYFDELDEDVSGKTILTTNIHEGQYLYHYFGINPYIDGRLETYISSLNKKADISNEFCYYLYCALDIEEFIEKYNFDYILVRSDMVVVEGIIKEMGYVEVLQIDSDDNQVLYALN